MNFVHCEITLAKSEGINCSIGGHFTSQSSSPEYALARGSELELIQLDSHGKIRSLCRTPVFAIIHSLQIIRRNSNSKDRLAISSDSGHVSIVEYDAQAAQWKIISVSGNIGRSGCRRNVAGQYLAVDATLNRALLVASIENEKLVFLLNSDGTISDQPPIALPSPQLSSSQSMDHVIFGVCSVAHPGANIMFAALEANANEKLLTVYEIDLSAKNINTFSIAVSSSSTLLLPLTEPDTIFVASQDEISRYSFQGTALVRTSTSALQGVAAKGMLVTVGVALPGKAPCVIIQTECGHLFAVSSTPSNITMTLLKAIAPCSSLALCSYADRDESLLFCAGEHSKHVLYSIATSPSCAIKLLDTMPHAGPITDLLVDDIANLDGPQIYQLCGKGSSAALKVLRPGCSVAQFASSHLPTAWGRPTGIFSLRQPAMAAQADGLDAFVLISYPSQTIVLSVDGAVVRAATSGDPAIPAFVTNTKTLGAIVLEDQAVLQIHSRGLRHISRAGNVSDWPAPDMHTVVKCCYNLRQVMLALNGGELIYFEVDSSGNTPILEMGTLDLGKEVTCMELGEGSGNSLKTPFAAVGCWDDTVQVISLSPQDLLAQRTASSFVARPESLSLLYSTGTAGAVIALFVGLANGELIKMNIHPATGALTVLRQLIVTSQAPTAVTLARVKVDIGVEAEAGGPAVSRSVTAVLAMASRTLLFFSMPSTAASGAVVLNDYESQVPFKSLDCACTISTATHRAGIASISGGRFIFYDLQGLRQLFCETLFPLKYTPRKMSRMPGCSAVAIVEAQCSSPLDGSDSAMEIECSSEASQLTGGLYPLSSPGRWSSCLRVLDVISGKTHALEELTGNVAALSVAALTFSDKSSLLITSAKSDQPSSTSGIGLQSSTAVSVLAYVVIGTAKNLSSPSAGSATAYSLETYQYVDGKLNFLHSTEVEDVPLAMIGFQDKLLVGVGKCLRIYDLGRKKLLRKSEQRGFPTHIARLAAHNSRIFVGDVANSVAFIRYTKVDNSLRVIADERKHPRFMTSMAALDDDTVAGGDRFGNMFVLRLPDSIDDDSDHVNEDPDSAVATADMFQTIGEKDAAKADNYLQSHYYLGEAVMGMAGCKLTPSGSRVILACTLSGHLACFVPLPQSEEIRFFQSLEAAIRAFQEEAGPCVRAMEGEAPEKGKDLSGVSVCYRNHLSYRSYFQPVKNIIDGDLCETFLRLPPAAQQRIAASMNRPLAEVRANIGRVRQAALG